MMPNYFVVVRGIPHTDQASGADRYYTEALLLVCKTEIDGEVPVDGVRRPLAEAANSDSFYGGGWEEGPYLTLKNKGGAEGPIFSTLEFLLVTKGMMEEFYDDPAGLQNGLANDLGFASTAELMSKYYVFWRNIDLKGLTGPNEGPVLEAWVTQSDMTAKVSRLPVTRTQWAQMSNLQRQSAQPNVSDYAYARLNLPSGTATSRFLAMYAGNSKSTTLSVVKKEQIKDYVCPMQFLNETNPGGSASQPQQTTDPEDVKNMIVDPQTTISVGPDPSPKTTPVAPTVETQPKTTTTSNTGGTTPKPSASAEDCPPKYAPDEVIDQPLPDGSVLKTYPNGRVEIVTCQGETVTLREAGPCEITCSETKLAPGSYTLVIPTEGSIQLDCVDQAGNKVPIRGDLDRTYFLSTSRRGAQNLISVGLRKGETIKFFSRGQQKEVKSVSGIPFNVLADRNTQVSIYDASGNLLISRKA